MERMGKDRNGGSMQGKYIISLRPQACLVGWFAAAFSPLACFIIGWQGIFIADGGYTVHR